jgi:hypothetical protein
VCVVAFFSSVHHYERDPEVQLGLFDGGKRRQAYVTRHVAVGRVGRSLSSLRTARYGRAQPRQVFLRERARGVGATGNLCFALRAFPGGVRPTPQARGPQHQLCRGARKHESMSP